MNNVVRPISAISLPFVAAFSLTFIACAGASASRYAVEDHQTIAKTLEIAKSVSVDNVNGSIEVIGYAGNRIELTARETIQARDREAVESARKEVSLDIAQDSGELRICVVGPFRKTCGTRDDWTHESPEPHYRVRYDITLRVPMHSDLKLRTINDGNIRVENVTGRFDLGNINGGVELIEVTGSGDIGTINGPVRAEFRAAPKESIAFHSINGRVDVAFPPDLSADLQLKTMNGKMYTDFDTSALPSAGARREPRGSGFVYHVNEFAGVRVGSGGPEIRFETLNGDVRITKRSATATGNKVTGSN